MSNELATMEDAELMNVLRNSLYPGAQDDSIKLAVSYCKAAGLDIMQKPVHLVPMWDAKTKRMRDVVMPGIGLYRTQAARSGEYAGVTEPEFGDDVTETFPEESGYEGKRRPEVTVTFPASCKVVVKRLMSDGSVAEFAATERWKENYATAGKDSRQPNSMWQKRPYGQLAKCAEAQALRKAFPEFGSQPTADEMEGKVYGVEIDVTPVKESNKSEPRAAWDKLDAETQEWMTNEAMAVAVMTNDGDIEGAYLHIESLKMDSDWKVAFWSRLDATQRSAIKAYSAIGHAASVEALDRVWGAVPKHAQAALEPVMVKRRADLTQIQMIAVAA